MSFENQKTPQEMAQIKKERAISDAELLKGGAEYKINDAGDEHLSATDEQVESARKEMAGDLNRKNIESKIENLSSDEKAYFDIKTELFKSLDNIEKLAKNGKIDKETESQMRQTILDMQNKSADPIFEKFSTDQTQREEKSGEIVKLAREAFNNQKKEVPDQNKENQIKQESKEINSEDIFEEVVKNPKMGAIFQREGKISGSVEKMNTPGTDNYNEDLKNNLKRFLLEFPTEKAFKAKEKHTEDLDNIIKKVKNEISSGRDVESNMSLLKGVEMRKREDQANGWEAQFGETYEESLKEFSQLLYEKFEKYQKEKAKKTEACISDAKSFDDLHKAVKISGGIHGSKDFFKPKVLTDLIEKVRKGEKSSDAITSSLGMRQKVNELLKLEEIRSKLES